MNKIILLIFFILVNVIVLNAQQVIQLYSGKAPGTENWNWQEHEKAVPFRHVYNVVNPTLTAYLPDSTIANGTSVIVCPGGAFQVQYIENEGTMIAEWLKGKGIAAFVLKYRLVHLFASQIKIDLKIELNEEFTIPM